jgi:hypothetical protein
MPALTLPAGDPALAIRDVEEVNISRRLMVLTRDRPMAPGLSTFLTAVTEQARRLFPGPRVMEAHPTEG